MSNAQILEMVDIFCDLNAEQLEQIYHICKRKTFNKDDVIFEENSPSKEMYIILEGEVEITVRRDIFQAKKQESHRITKLGQGQCFGEVSLVDQGLRSAEARCLSETCRMLVLDRDKFLKLLKSDLQIGFNVMYNLAADMCLKMRRTTYIVRESLLYGNSDEPG